MGIREEYQAFIERQFNEWKTYTERLKSQADQFNAQSQAHFNQALETLRAKQNEAWDHFLKLKEASEEGWAQGKKQLDKTWDEIRAASDRITDQFRKK